MTARFVRFTLAMGSPGRSVHLNTAAVTAVEEAPGFTRVWLGADHYFEVSDSAAEVLTAIALARSQSDG